MRHVPPPPHLRLQASSAESHPSHSPPSNQTHNRSNLLPRHPLPRTRLHARPAPSHPHTRLHCRRHRRMSLTCVGCVRRPCLPRMPPPRAADEPLTPLNHPHLLSRHSCSRRAPNPYSCCARLTLRRVRRARPLQSRTTTCRRVPHPVRRPMRLTQERQSPTSRLSSTRILSSRASEVSRNFKPDLSMFRACLKEARHLLHKRQASTLQAPSPPKSLRLLTTNTARTIVRHRRSASSPHSDGMLCVPCLPPSKASRGTTTHVNPPRPSQHPAHGRSCCYCCC